jgi:ParB family transcriptional regulator, chromosome partitioning protein
MGRGFRRGTSGRPAIHHAQVVRALALLELPQPIREQVEQGALPPATAYEISKVKDPAERRALATRVVAEGLSWSETIEAVREVAGRSAGGKAKGRGAQAKPRKVTSRTLRTSAGEVTVENRRGLEPAALVTALREALDQAQADLRGRGEAAA